MAIYSTDKVGWSRTLRAAYRYAANNDYASAIKFYNEALKEGRNKGLIYNNLADAYLQAGQLDRATACAGEASGRRGDSVPHVTLGQIYQAKGEHKKAVD
ncbi:MAG: tetratricopeptide repeat protein, partial [Candidatus Euphemobacter frigidus]|nr:tetratricopeptide repeat protein [Candidatus Euphemobacter frigidus]